jgi:dynein intermediate chain
MSDASRSARATALEDKKRRLEELKARRAMRETLPADTPKPSANLDEYIDGLLKQSAPGVPESVVTVNKGQGQQRDGHGGQKAQGTTQAIKSEPSEPVISPSPATAAAQVVIQKPRVDTFEFGTQTFDDDFPLEQEEDDLPVAGEPTTNNGDENTPALIEEQKIEVEPKILNDEEKEETVVKVSFSTFLNTASKKVERLLGEPVLADLLVNYVGETDGAEAIEKRPDGSKYVSARQVFEHSKWTAGRTVTDVDWSPHHRELMLSSHDMASSSTNVGSGLLTAVSPDVPPSASLAPRSGELESDGLCLVWNLSMPARPEHIFTCGSPVVSSKFHPTESPLVIGGCQSGQLVIWDVRAGRLPVQRSGQGYPISSIHVVEGGVSVCRFSAYHAFILPAHILQSGLVTSSTDGKLSFWSLANLRDPAEVVQLNGNLSCVAVASNNAFYCGDESGALFYVPAKRKQVKKREAHFGLVTAVSVKKNMVLSSGVDWTVKLTKNDKAIWSVVSNSYDYMCDVQWNPVHPSLLSTASSNGNVGLWNLADSIEVPIGEVVVEPSVGLNKVRWSADGRRLSVAAGERVHVLSLADDVLRQKGDEEERMTNLLA